MVGVGEVKVAANAVKRQTQLPQIRTAFTGLAFKHRLSTPGLGKDVASRKSINSSSLFARRNWQ